MRTLIRRLAASSAVLIVPTTGWAHPAPAVHVHPEGGVLLAALLLVLGLLAVRRLRSRA